MRRCCPASSFGTVCAYSKDKQTFCLLPIQQLKGGLDPWKTRIVACTGMTGRALFQKNGAFRYEGLIRRIP